MRLGQLTSGILIAFAAAAGTFGVQQVDRVRSEQTMSEFGLRTARQIVSQAEGLALNAKTRAETDPLGWAIGYLAQGVEPRTVQISKHRGPVGVPSEAHQLSSDGWFEYAKVTQPENGSGVRVRIRLGYRGFLDSRTTFGNDLSIAVFFILLWCALQGMLGLASMFSGYRPRVSGPQLQAWALKGETVLIQLGARILELFRDATRLRSVALASIEQRSRTRRQVHAQIRRLHEARRALKLSAKALLAVEHALSQPGRLPDPRKIAQWLSATRTLGGKIETGLRELEMELEPFATDLDIAFQSDASTEEIAAELNARIEAAKQALKEHALFVRELRQAAPEQPVKKEKVA